MSCGTWGWSRCKHTKTTWATCYKTCVNGGWTSWSYHTHGSCSVTCGGGTRTRTDTRTCTNPTPSNGGSRCSGSSSQTVKESCNTHHCPINGGWSSWSYHTNGSCSVTCGDGTRTRTDTRTCTNPMPSNGGRSCSGNSYKYTSSSCNIQACIIDGGWSAWSSSVTGTCSQSCGGGYKTRTDRRTCTNPAPQNGGRFCSGDNAELTVRPCNTQACPRRSTKQSLAEGQASKVNLNDTDEKTNSSALSITSSANVTINDSPVVSTVQPLNQNQTTEVELNDINTSTPNITSSQDANSTVPNITSSLDANSTVPNSTSSQDVNSTVPNITSSRDANSTVPNITSSQDANSTVPNITSSQDVNSTVPNITSSLDANSTVPNITSSRDANSTVPNITSSQDVNSTVPNITSSLDANSTVPNITSSRDANSTVPNITSS
ncbi:hypothetical protein V1264_006798 [Littorina saxatilis]